MAHYRTIFISDIHLGARASQDKALLNFLKSNTCDKLYLVGDVIDGWQLVRNWYWPEIHTEIFIDILQKAQNGMELFYILGNHDDFLRKFLPFLQGYDLAKISNTAEFITKKGKKFLITHGDIEFDQKAMNREWLARHGDWWYMTLLRLNKPLNYIRKLLGYDSYFSIAKFAKQNVKKLIMKKTDYYGMVEQFARDNGYEGMVTGHIHKAQVKDINGITYLNCGDWVESNTAIVEDENGEFRVLRTELTN